MYPPQGVRNDPRYREARCFQDHGDARTAIEIWNQLAGSKAASLDLWLEALRQQAVCYRLLGDVESAACEFLSTVEEAKKHDRPLIAALARLDYSALLLTTSRRREAESEVEQALFEILEEVRDVSHPLVGVALGYLGRVYGSSSDKKVRRRGALLLVLADTYLRFCGDVQYRSQRLTNLVWLIEAPTLIGYPYLPTALVEALRQRNARRLGEVVVLAFAGRQARAKLRARLQRR